MPRRRVEHVQRWEEADERKRRPCQSRFASGTGCRTGLQVRDEAVGAELGGAELDEMRLGTVGMSSVH
jgi:hypothetical protein